MESKANMPVDGCFNRALHDEPMFILLARDRCAPDAIRHWADTRSKLAIAEDWSEDAERITSAIETAEAMSLWRAQNQGSWRRPVAAPIVTEASLGDISLRILRRGAALGIDAASIPNCGARMVSVETFNTLLADAQKLAAYVAQHRLPIEGPVDA